MSGYAFRDAWSHSDVELTRHAYTNMIYWLENKLTAINLDLDFLRSRLEADVLSFTATGSGDASSGEVVDRFEAALSRWNASVGLLINRMGIYEAAVHLLEAKLRELRRRQGILDQMWLEEDAREKEFLLSEIVF